MTKRLSVALIAGVASALAVAAVASAAFVPVRMTGGGWVDNPDILGDPTAKISFGTTLPCNAGIDDPELLVVQFHNGRNTFRLTDLTFADCTVDNPDLRKSPGSLTGIGTGTCGGQAASADFTLRDGARADSAKLQIVGAATGCTLSLSAPIQGGNLTLQVDNPEL